MKRLPGSSVRAVRRVVRLNGRTRLVGIRSPGGEWRQVRPQRFTRDVAVRLLDDGVSSVILRRRFRGAVSIPLSWLGFTSGRRAA